jgi:uncharacterized membrane protein
MAVLIVLLGSLMLFRAAGALGVEALDSWLAAARWALALMLLFTAAAHFTRMKEDLVRMVPPWVRWPRQVVALTGVCEVLGAIGILVPATRKLAGILLIVFFIAILPANIHAARAGASLGGRPATPLWLRIPMQLLFIALAWCVTQPVASS